MAQIEAQPIAIDFRNSETALLIIDMQRDFLYPGGFGEALGNDVSLLSGAIDPCRSLLAKARDLGMLVVHTREGHLADLSDVPLSKQARCPDGQKIGDLGPMGRILIRGEPGHGIIEELLPVAGEVVIDKPGKGAFYATNLQDILSDAGIKNLIICGVTTEVCVHSTIREANDRGYSCLLISDACASYCSEFHDAAIAMISAQGGIFGYVSDSRRLLQVWSS